MATELGVAYISLLPEMRSFRPAAEKGMDRVGKGVATRFGVGFNGAIGSIVSRSAGIFAAGFASVKIGGFLKDAIAQASDLGETTSKVSQIFGPAAKDIINFSKTSSTALGQTQQAALDANATFGIFGKAAGLQGKELSGFTTQLTTLASDLASFNNTSPEQAIEAIGAALRGETEPMRAYGVLLDDASLRQEALAQGLIKTTKQALTPQQKVLAAQALIMKQTTTAQGDFARTSGGLANQQRILTARFSDFKTSIGAIALPLATRFFGFLNERAIPVLTEIRGGFVAFFAAFKAGDGDITSSGFPGFMEKLGFHARTTFDYFKAEVLPRLKDFGGFVKTEVVPALKDMAGFVSKNRDFFVPFAGAIVAIVAGLKAWAIIQGVLNVVLAANPIGLVVLAIAGLVAGLVWAYRNSIEFRKVVDAAFKVVAAAAKFMWDVVIKPLLGLFVDQLKKLWLSAQDMATKMSAAWGAIKEPARVAIKFVIDKFLDMVELVLKGAAKAFGWVPDLGDKLKNAATEFGKFRTSVNKALDGIDDEPVDIKVGLAYTQALGQRTKQMKFAAGGGVFGGTPGKDSVPALLMPNEHVWTTKEVAAAGGHGAMHRMRQAALRGELRGYASGGMVINPLLPSSRRLQLLANAAAGDVDHIGTNVAAAIAKQLAAQAMGPVGPPGARKSFRGVTLNQRTISMLLNAERILGRAFHITQGSYSTRVAASGSTHAGGGAMDTNGPGGWGAAVAALRKAGFAAWYRSPSQGPWGPHIHSIARGDSSASAAAKAQVRDFERGGDGLAGMAGGGRVLPKALSFDSGGLLPTGYSLVHNGTGAPEPVGHDVLRVGDLDGMRIELDTGETTLTGHIRLTAREEIRSANKQLKRRVGSGQTWA
jgi:hypothetical protein